MSDSTALTFDKSALTERVDPVSVKTQARETVDAQGGGVTSRRFRGNAWFVGIGTAVGMAVGAAIGVILLTVVVGGLTHRRTSLLFLVLAWAVLALPYAYRRIARVARQLHDADDRWYRLSRFAPANVLTHALSEPDPRRSATVFATAEGPLLSDPVVGTSPRPLEVANLSFHIGGGRARLDVAMAYVRFGTAAVLPAMSIQSVTAPGGAAWRPPEPQAPIAIEDAFDRRFRVSCAPEDAAAVRALLGPEARADLVDVAGDADVQVVDGEAWFFARQDLRLQDPVVWEWVEDLSALLDRSFDPRPGVPPRPQDPARAQRRRAVLRGAGAGRPFVLGCMVPVVVAIAVLVAGALMG